MNCVWKQNTNTFVTHSRCLNTRALCQTALRLTHPSFCSTSPSFSHHLIKTDQKTFFSLMCSVCGEVQINCLQQHTTVHTENCFTMLCSLTSPLINTSPFTVLAHKPAVQCVQRSPARPRNRGQSDRRLRRTRT
jgi:hypothetical protein